MRETLLRSLREGREDDTLIEMEITEAQKPLDLPGGMGIELNLGEMLGNLMPKRKKTRSVTVKEAMQYLIVEESEKRLDMDAVNSEALRRAEQEGIIFIDEIDKITARGGNASGADVSREGVQRDILPIVEGSTVQTKYGSIKTDFILFIASGAFMLAKVEDLIPELQGRFPIRV